MNKKPKAIKKVAKAEEIDNFDQEKKLGRPTEYIDGVTDLAVLGAFWENELITIDELAKLLKVHKDTIYCWAQKYPSFSDALEKGRKGLRNVIIGAGLKEILPYFYCEEFLGKDGPVMLKKYARPSNAMLKLFLSNYGIKENTVVEQKTTLNSLDVSKLNSAEQETLYALLNKAK